MYIYIFLTILILLTGVETLSAQVNEIWNRAYGGQDSEIATAVVQTPDGGYAIAGKTHTFGAGNTEMYLVRTDAAGDVIWTQTVGGDMIDECYAMIQTSDGGFALAGVTNSFGAGYADCYLAKIDEEGDVLWTRTFGGEQYETFYAITEMADGRLAMAGLRNVFQTVHWMLVITDEDGNNASEFYYDHAGANDEWCSSIIQASDGDLVLGGHSRPNGLWRTQFRLVKVNPNGNLTWASSFGGANNDEGFALIETTDGGFALAGMTDPGDNASWDGCLAKTDADGNLTWVQSYSEAYFDKLVSLIQTDDGGYAMAGQALSIDYAVQEGWLVVADEDGEKILSQTFDNGNRFYSLAATSDGGFILAGATTVFGAGGYDFWAIKTTHWFDGYNDFVQTQDEQPVLVLLSEFDNAPVPSGWEIGIFTPGGVQSGGGVWVDGDTLGITAWGDDDNTQVVEGFVEDEEMEFRIWDNNTNVEYMAFATVITGDIHWHDGDGTAVELVGYQIYTMDIVLAQNWNIISINVVPPVIDYWTNNQGPDIQLMMAQFAGNLLLMKDEDGRFYWPAFNFCNIPFWNLQEGYKVKMSQQQQGSWTGAQISASFDVPIETGWNIIAYFPTYTLSADENTNPPFHVIQPIVNNVLIAKNSHGEFMLPQNNYADMPNWEEGQGYQIKVNANVVLNYPEHDNNIDAVELSPVQPVIGHYGSLSNTGANMSILVSSINGFSARDDDQIAAYDASGKIVGVGTVQNGMCGLAVWGDDVSTEEIDGLQVGEAFTLRLWDADKEVELSLEPSALQGSLGYETDGFANLSANAIVSVPDNFYLSNSYPNPFNSTTRISFGLPTSGRLSITVYDMAGRLIATLADKAFDAGNHSTVWNAETTPAGLYMVRMQSGSFSDVIKVTLVK